ncbi:stage II sporulation protein E [Clostridium tetanomorphum]|uniref:Stage II sporulation protein E n=1 Tax=Clostridium tetanomorphum TaxID=1553 RepID=A0A923EDE9_CLOTT|nr:stage II sporulation protein E [Clostridium tetanomorphum]MBC2400026.1 stage II sporulation protein E [Clostridium tetanomorphum]MBP1866474.1 stage II sporulation protein E [Clostridium tetanomorphum]NRS86404.1 stage II sporulation protein E [Clostridium tetanomorphum]NRZ95567.1 stage II sporulation protein E [Clostridium tetanomorphum]SQC00587.1 stage II sporulation protein E [Clostridium tetanomorphum]
MQYGAEIFPYQRIRKVNKDKHDKKEYNISFVYKCLFYFFSGVLISRVIMVNLIAPFGIAFLITTISNKNKRLILISSIGTLIGYFSLYSSVKNIWMYIISILIITTIGYIFDNTKSRFKLYTSFASIFFLITLYNRFMLHITMLISVFNALFQIACIFPIYYILNYSMSCIKEIKTKNIYSSEEIISISISLSLIIGGTWGISIFGLSLRNILALTFIIVIGYIKGASAGGAAGVAMGAIIGISTNNMVTFIGTYGICGLIAGVFKETGKWISGIAYIVMFSILKLYSDIGVQFQINEALVALVIYYVVPVKIYKKMELELDWELKGENLKENYINNVKELFNNKLNNFSQLLVDMAKTLENLADNDKLRLKTKSSAIVENLADRVCSGCNMKSICWKRESFYTYSAFSELIENYQSKKQEVPYEIERKCIKRSALIKNTEDIVKNYIIDEMWRNRLSECRQFLGTQISNISNSVEEMTEDINSNIKFNKYVENDIRRILNKNNIKYRDVFCYNDKKERLMIKLSMEACGGKQKCIKQILPLINIVTGKIMCVGDDGCNIDINNKTCNILIEETPKYHVASYAGRLCKDGEKLNGDSYVFDKLKDGSYITVISDGMGSGPEAGQESNASVNLIEGFVKAGFSKITAINTVNSLMTIKFSQDEKFSTMDLSSIDLYNGEIDFMKVGAVASFIKSNDNIDVIKSKTLPIGVLDKVDVDIIKKQVGNGDIVVMLSDGVLDYNSNEAGKVDWLVKYLKECNENNPEELCKGIINRAKELCKGKVKDDMTVVVSKVYSLY